MRLSPNTFVALAAFGLAAFGLAGGCTKPDTVLLVEVAGPASVHPNQLQVTVSAGIDSHVLMVPAQPLDDEHQMQLPTSFTIGLDQSRTAPIVVAIDALDVVSSPLGFSGSTTYQHVEIGGQTTVTVFLADVTGSDGPDGGAAGDSGAAGGGGGSGAGGAGGAAGRGGAGDDAGMDLDGAAD